MPLSHFLASDSSPGIERAVVSRLGAQFRSLDKSIRVTPNADKRARTTDVNTQAKSNTPNQGANSKTRAAKTWIPIMNRATIDASNSGFMMLPFCVL
jgi:hypothetical protein